VRRGQSWEYQPVIERPGQSRLRLIMSVDEINDADLPWCLGIQIRDRDPGGMFVVRIEPHGWANLVTAEMVMRRRLVEQVGTASAAEIEAVEMAIAAMYGLRR
jgi:mRNA-degrading endonuclease toxin of MazEF toxin-antitoxin module